MDSHLEINNNSNSKINIKLKINRMMLAPLLLKSTNPTPPNNSAKR